MNAAPFSLSAVGRIRLAIYFDAVKRQYADPMEASWDNYRRVETDTTYLEAMARLNTWVMIELHTLATEHLVRQLYEARL